MKNFFLFFFMMVSLTLTAQTPVQNFTLINVADGASISLNSYPARSGLVIIFTSNVCPFDNYYFDRIRNLINAYPGKIQFLLINSFQDPEESADKMKTTYSLWNLPVPYLADKEQIAMDCLGAKKSPEVFLLSGSPGKYQVAYHGAIDDNPQSPPAVTAHYLNAAIDKLLAGQKIDVATVRAVGCTMRRK